MCGFSLLGIRYRKHDSFIRAFTDKKMIHQRLTQSPIAWSAAFFIIIHTIAIRDDESKREGHIETRLLGRNGNAIALARN